MKYIPLTTLLFVLLFAASCNQQPTQLSGKTETIEVSYVNWVCDCANFIESDSPDDDPQREEKCFYVEPANESLKIPEEYYNTGHFTHDIKITGQFYNDKGVPDAYERKTSERPESARVFRYDGFEMVRKAE